MRNLIFPVLAIFLATSQAKAEVCDYRPSKLLGVGGTAGTTAATGTVGAFGAGANAAGLYTITHASSGAVMVGSTMAGKSAAGTVGIIGGTAGWGSAVAVAANPLVWIPAAVIAVGVGGYEGVCWFTKDDSEADTN